MNFALDERERADCSIEDLARIICRYMKEIIRKDKKDIHKLEDMMAILGSEKGD